MGIKRRISWILPLVLPSLTLAAQPALLVAVDSHGTYRLGLQGASAPTLISDVAAQVDGRWLHASDYPACRVVRSAGQGVLGAATVWDVTCFGLEAAPELTYRLRAYAALPFADLTATVRNTGSRPVQVEAIRVVDAGGGDIADLGARTGSERVLSDSFSEDRPAMSIHALADARHGMHRAVGSQLIYNRDSHESLFLGALSSDRFLTILRLHVAPGAGDPRITSYQVDSTGTTELELENSLADSTAGDRITLDLPVAPGGALSSEALALSVDRDYHRQLETYGGLIRRLHHARVTAPPLMGWWSWTAYYFGLDAGAAVTNAQWLAEHFERYGYTLFHVDEGYQYARGEYTTPDETLFPHGLVPVEYAVRGLGLTPGMWTAPFEVSERSWVFQHHPDWLVKNAAGRPIHAGTVVDGKDPLYILDATNPGAQAYLRMTYRTLVREWGIHYIKLDFMDDSAIEGYYYRPHTTAMQAQRIGLQIIRDAVGNDVYLDKDGSVMLNPVGYVDYGRISQDTGHSFGASRDAAVGIAARYFMERNFFVSDPDAFTVSTQRITDQTWHEGSEPLTLDEAEVSIALAAVSGGMLEIGDNLPSLQGSPDRVALIENRDLIDMVQLGKASVPVDLMSYADSDRQPSIFFLQGIRAAEHPHRIQLDGACHPACHHTREPRSLSRRHISRRRRPASAAALAIFRWRLPHRAAAALGTRAEDHRCESAGPDTAPRHRVPGSVSVGPAGSLRSNRAGRPTGRGLSLGIRRRYCRHWWRRDTHLDGARHLQHRPRGNCPRWLSGDTARRHPDHRPPVHRIQPIEDSAPG